MHRAPPMPPPRPTPVPNERPTNTWVQIISGEPAPPLAPVVLNRPITWEDPSK